MKAGGDQLVMFYDPASGIAPPDWWYVKTVEVDGHDVARCRNVFHTAGKAMLQCQLPHGHAGSHVSDVTGLRYQWSGKL